MLRRVRSLVVEAVEAVVAVLGTMEAAALVTTEVTALVTTEAVALVLMEAVGDRREAGVMTWIMTRKDEET